MKKQFVSLLIACAVALAIGPSLHAETSTPTFAGVPESFDEPFDAVNLVGIDGDDSAPYHVEVMLSCWSQYFLPYAEMPAGIAGIFLGGLLNAGVCWMEDYAQLAHELAVDLLAHNVLSAFNTFGHDYARIDYLSAGFSCTLGWSPYNEPFCTYEEADVYVSGLAWCNSQPDGSASLGCPCWNDYWCGDLLDCEGADEPEVPGYCIQTIMIIE